MSEQLPQWILDGLRRLYEKLYGDNKAVNK